MKQELLTMLALQNEMNARIHPDWRNQGYDWYRAIWIESAELMDHYGWKWWKKQDRDLAQVELELIDIWHFGLSDMLERQEDTTSIANTVSARMSEVVETEDFLTELEAFTLSVLQQRMFDVDRFSRLMAAAGLPFQHLFRGYIGKNVLNFFRQDHGYKLGTYIKNWHGREDNEHLVEAIAELDSANEHFREHLYAALQKRYSNVK